MRLDLSRDRLLLLVASLALMVPVLRFYWPAGDGLDVVGYPLGRDFINVWSGPQVAFGDKVSALFDLRGYHEAIGRLFGTPLPFHNWGYPLFTLPAFWPLAQLPYFWALAVWTVGLFAIFAAIVLAEVEPDRRRQALLLLALTPACLINAIGGQNGFLSAALFLGGVLNIDRRPILAGVLIGLLTFKPHLGIVLPFALVALGAWRVIASAAVTALALVAVSTAIFGLDAWRDYFAVVGPYQTELLRQLRGLLHQHDGVGAGQRAQAGPVLFDRARRPGDRLALARSHWPAGPCAASPIRARAPSCWSPPRSWPRPMPSTTT